MDQKINLITAIIEFLTVIIPVFIGFAFKKIYVYLFIVIFIDLAIVIITIICISIRTRNLQRCIGNLNKRISLCERDLYYTMKNSYKRDDNISTMNEITISGLRNYVNLIAELLSKYVKKTVTVSIRFFEEIQSPIDNSFLSVLVFSENCEKDRENIFKNNKINKKQISKNTDFKSIISEQRENQLDYFYESNLNNLHKKLKSPNCVGYENTTPNWNLFYKGRIIIPIYMEDHILFFKTEKTGRDIKGFLCADVKQANKFPTSNKKKYFLIDLLESYSSKLHIILNKYNYYLDNMAKGVKHDEKFHRITEKDI